MATLSRSKSSAHDPRPRLPDRIKVLYVTTLHRSSAWLTEAFAADSATHVVLRETVGVTAGLALLRDEAFDAVLVSHEPGVLDALDFVEALRTGGHDEPMVVLGDDPPEQFQALAYEVGADAYCWVEQTTTRSLLWELARGIRRYELVTENRRLVEAQRQRLASEHQEAERILNEQRSLLAELEAIESGTHDGQQAWLPSNAHSDILPSERRTLSPSIVKHYRDLLQAYVVMGAGNMAREMSRLRDVLVMEEISAYQAMQLHVEVLEGMIQGLGRRSARHVMNRADLLAMEITVHLADGYRRRYLDRRFPPTQQLLPGFEAFVDLRDRGRDDSDDQLPA